MNAPQVSSIIDRAATVVATWALTWLASHGYISQSDIVAFLPILIALPAAFVGWWKNRQSAVLANVDALAKDPTSPVKGVILSNSTEGRELARDIPGLTTVVAGTPEATAIAKTGT